MPAKVPDGYLSLSSLSSNTNREVNLMGVVVDFQPPAKSRGTDWMCTFRLADATIYDDGVKIRFFRPMEMELPRIERNGDVVILERVKITSWSGMIMGISSFSTNWTVLPATSIPDTPPKGELNLKCLREKGSSGTTQQQMRYAIELCNSRERGARETSPAPVRSSPSTFSKQAPAESWPTASTQSNYRRHDKFALIKDIQVETFYDLVGQVVKVYPSNGVVELYLTDYTSNPLLFNYEWGCDDPTAEPDEGNSLYGSASSTSRQWPGPPGKVILTVSLFPPHSYYAQNNVKENHFVFLRNTRIKWSKDSKVEGCLHTDQRNSDRVDITIIKDHSNARVKEVLRRKLEYTKRFQKQSDALVEIARGQKRKQAEQPKLSKAQQRKRRKQQREEEARRKQNDFGSSDEDRNKENDDPYRVHVTSTSNSKRHNERHSTPATSPPPTQPPKRANALNKNIRTSKPNVPPRPLSSILSFSTHTLTTPSGIPYTLPFQNINSRAAVRVVDFFPPDIADFAVRKKKESEYDVLSDHSEVSSSSSSSSSSSGDENPSRLPADTDDDPNITHGSHSQKQAEDTAESTLKWQWRFALILEDASSPPSLKERGPRLTAYVTGADAEFLLKLDACNLHREPQALAALREKLFLLWGDLEERKRDVVGRTGEAGTTTMRSMPFECCVKEYGVRSREVRRRLQRTAEDVRSDDDDDEKGEEEEGGEEGEENWGWERRFAMFGTTIL
ncbi:MAG: hypothetical protein Q9216_004414 [Gyalolechia sp. 2 TL-2023]